MKLVRMKIAGYRSLVDVDFAVRPLTVLIGPNGSGKTSVLDAFSLLRAGFQETLSRALIHRGGLQAVLSRVQPKATTLEWRLNFEDQNKQIFAYSFALAPEATGFMVVREQVERFNPESDTWVAWLRRGKGVVYAPSALDPAKNEYWDVDSDELGLQQLPNTSIAGSIRATLSRSITYRPLVVEPRAIVRLPQTLTPDRTLTPDGETLFSVLYNLREHSAENYTRILDALRLVFPGFQRLEFPIVGAGQVSMAWYQDHLVGPLYPNELSDGTLRFLWLATILLTPEPPPLVLIDEPESSLHPQMLHALAELMQDAALRTTVIVATHATELIRWLQPDQVLVLDKEDGRTRATWADQMDLDAWLREYTLSDLWLMGNLGGRS